MPRHEWLQRFSSSNSTSVLLPVLSLNFHHLQSPSSTLAAATPLMMDGVYRSPRPVHVKAMEIKSPDNDAMERACLSSPIFLAYLRKIFSAQDGAIDSISLPFNSHISHISHIPQLRKHQQFRRTRLLSPHKETPTRSSSEERLS